MRRVILIGDSIRMGYQPYVAAALSGMAEVWGPEANGGPSANVLGHLDEWVLDREADVIHLNCGLHDVARFAEQERRSHVTVDGYRANLRAVFERIVKGHCGRLIWARTTPVIEVWHNTTKDRWRYNGDIAQFNAAADELAGEFGLPRHDLHGIVMSAGPGNLLVGDGAHYTPAGSAMLGAAVARFVGRYL